MSVVNFESMANDPERRSENNDGLSSSDMPSRTSDIPQFEDDGPIKLSDGTEIPMPTPEGDGGDGSPEGETWKEALEKVIPEILENAITEVLEKCGIESNPFKDGESTVKGDVRDGDDNPEVGILDAISDAILDVLKTAMPEIFEILEKINIDGTSLKDIIEKCLPEILEKVKPLILAKVMPMILGITNPVLRGVLLKVVPLLLEKTVPEILEVVIEVVISEILERNKP